MEIKGVLLYNQEHHFDSQVIDLDYGTGVSAGGKSIVEQYRHLVKQASGKHVVLHCLRLEDGHSYRETPDRLKYMTEVCDVLGLDRDDLLDYSTIYKSF